MLLVLIQLPKKEAGAGVAFGGAATDALFGAGSGNALTKMTKYTATFFVVLSLSLSILNSNSSKESNRRLEEELLKKANEPAALVVPPVSTPAVTSSGGLSLPAETLSAGTATNSLQTLLSNGVSAAVSTVSEAAAESLESTEARATGAPTGTIPAPSPETPPE